MAVDHNAIAARILVRGGATWNEDGDEPPATGYAVAVPGYEHVTRRYLRGGSGRTVAALANDLARYMGETVEAVVDNSALWWGAWLNTGPDGTDPAGPVHLDVTAIFATREVATEVAAAFGELAVYDLANGEEIFIPA